MRLMARMRASEIEMTTAGEMSDQYETRTAAAETSEAICRARRKVSLCGGRRQRRRRGRTAIV